ncbi:alginate lyase family protein [Cellulophaga tyrosinoxydans]|uniref:Alginate lyase n=1 Tax=Cellulophaga tyrosinoxydans TaxID=504486 RepID=A0A1W2BPE7_9FLAO|nr:alginate lyase family protein [Cellulophaga tyrosinoxydans]SMC74743.1 Alginate lyase [Cellulophaga tyrosinoxydans]
MIVLKLKSITISLLLNVFTILLVFNVQAQNHPKLNLTKAGVAKIRAELGKVPLFDASLAVIKEEVDAEIALGIFVPIPKDFSGGYTHERHKRNFLILQKAGVLFQILEDEKYAIYIRDMFMAYAELYPKLPVHPQERSYARGKLFWQCLNDSNWLVYTSQAYDCIYDWLSKKERKHLEKKLFIPFANFISEGNPQFFNRVHNHSTWGNVAVGMIALVMDNDDLLQKALYGLKTDNLEVGMKDNDGGFIKVEGQKVGFFANLDEPFSPDGYYTEGPYYQRYAMYPFLIFAQALQNVKPEFKIFEYKDSVLLKSVTTLINLSDSDGNFFPINDGQKGMSYYSRELVTALDIAYLFGGENPELLSIAEKQGKVTVDDAGLEVALGLKEGKALPFIKKSLELTDGPKGDQGGLAIIRKDGLELVFKYAAQGLSHGHYDKLSYSLYTNGNELVQDYGLARFVNIEQKGGGNYLKENTTWAKQTIAHNTLVQDETSHFKGEYEIGSQFASKKYFLDISNPNIQIASAKEINAYKGTELHRTMAMIKDESLTYPYVLDIMRVTSDSVHQYDLPFYYLGQLMQTNFKYNSPKVLQQLGEKNGYQHLFEEGKAKISQENSTLNWMSNDKFYTLTAITAENDEIIFTRIGANDPEFNLRRDPGMIIRKKGVKDALFVSIIEPHGTYSPVSEFAVNAYSAIDKMTVLLNDEAYTVIEIRFKNETSKVIAIANLDNSENSKHKLTIADTIYQWSGPYYSK